MKRAMIGLSKLASKFLPFFNACRNTYASSYVVRGIDFLENNNLNKSLAFTLEERQALGIHGLLAPQVRSMEDQIKVCNISLSRLPDNLQRFAYLTELQETNQKLFYNVLNSNIEKYLPMIYSPTVGEVCQKIGLLYRRPRGLFVSLRDKGHIVDILKNWPNQQVKAVIFTDGERTMGTGDSGAHAMALPVSKSTLYTALGRIAPKDILPVALDCGTDNKALLEDPLYIGLRQKRARGKEYDDFIDEFMSACREVFGSTCLLQFEDFTVANGARLLDKYKLSYCTFNDDIQGTAAVVLGGLMFEDFTVANGARLLDKYKLSYCTFNDDIQGTAAVVLGGLMASSRITEKSLSENTYLFHGAGLEAVGIANLLLDAMLEEGLSREDALKRIWMYDDDGLLSNKRVQGIPPRLAQFARNDEPDAKFTQRTVYNTEANVLIGSTGMLGSITPEMLYQMGRNSYKPIIFALTKSPNRVECTAEEAYSNTQGRCIFASGTPFPTVNYKDKEIQPAYINNAYIYPGLALGVTSVDALQTPDYMFYTAAKTLADQLTHKELQNEKIYPPMKDLQKISLSIAIEVANLAYCMDLAMKYPEPSNLDQYIAKSLYKFDYDNYLPKMFYCN